MGINISCNRCSDYPPREELCRVYGLYPCVSEDDGMTTIEFDAEGFGIERIG